MINCLLCSFNAPPISKQFEFIQDLLDVWIFWYFFLAVELLQMLCWSTFLQHLTLKQQWPNISTHSACYKGSHLRYYTLVGWRLNFDLNLNIKITTCIILLHANNITAEKRNSKRYAMSKECLYDSSSTSVYISFYCTLTTIVSLLVVLPGTSISISLL